MTNLASKPPPLPGATTPAYRRYVFGLLLGLATLNFLDRQIINILVEPIKNELSLKDWQMGVLSGLGFAIFYSVLGLPIARLADRGNRPAIIGVSLIVWSAATAACGIAGSFSQILLGRIGVGIGEAGGGPPAHSLIAEYSTPQTRASALAFFSLGNPIGTLIGLSMGAVVADAYGWRAAFMVAAAPGILFGILILTTMREPRQQRPPPPSDTSIRAVWQELRAKPTFWWVCFASAMASIATYGQGAFWGSFFMRTHGIEIAALGSGMGALAVVGVTLGLVKGLSGIAGTLVGGAVTDRLVRRDLRYFCTVPAVALALASPAFVLVMLAPGFRSAAGLLILPVFLSTVIFGPIFASVQTLVTPGTRATAASILLFILTLAGLGLGPLSIGLLSDYFARTLGSAEGLRYALLCTAPANLLAAAGFWIARRTIVGDLELD